MKFFTSTLATALAVGSAVAVPMNAARDYNHEPPLNSGPWPPVTVTAAPGVFPSGGDSSYGTGTGYPKPTSSGFPAHPPPVPSASVSSVEVSSVSVPASVSSASASVAPEFPTISISSIEVSSAPTESFPTVTGSASSVEVPPASSEVSTISISSVEVSSASATSVSVSSVSASAAPSGVPDQVYDPENIIVIIKKISFQIIHIEELIEIDIKNINIQLIHIHNLDPQALLAAIVSLKLHLKYVFTEMVPILEAAKEHPDSLNDADLKVVLALVDKVQTIVKKVEHVLKKVVYTVKTDVLMVVGAELHDLIRLVLPITGRIVKVVLDLVVYADVNHSHQVDKVTYVCRHIINITSRITGLLVNPILVPIFQHISDGQQA